MTQPGWTASRRRLDDYSRRLGVLLDVGNKLRIVGRQEARAHVAAVQRVLPRHQLLGLRACAEMVVPLCLHGFVHFVTICEGIRMAVGCSVLKMSRIWGLRGFTQS